MPERTVPALPERYLGPGLVDLQLNGYSGFDFNARPEHWTAEQLRGVRRALRRRGVVAALPTLITDAPSRMLERARRYARLVADCEELSATFPRLHVEGPFICPDEGPRGAHPLRHCHTPRQFPDFLPQLREASGERVGIITLAPELPGALELIAEGAKAGICMAIGHTSAAPERIAEAVEAGARMSTHLGNGSHQRLPRLANYVQAQLADDRLFASFIADGHHLPWYTLQNFIRAKTSARSVLVTDAVAPADAAPGVYRLGDEEIVATAEGRVQKPGQPNLAGSALTLDRAVANVALHCGVPFDEAWEMASTRAAALVGLPPPEEVVVHVAADGFRRHSEPS